MLNQKKTINLYLIKPNKMKTLFYCVLLAFTTSIFSQTKKDSIASKIMNETRTYSVFVPANYEKNKGKKYPLLFLLDGDYLFDPVVGALKYGNYWDDLPEVIVVGLHQNTNNERDTDCEIGDNGLPAFKGIKFFDFINNELLPTIEKEFRVAPLRIIAGHDLTATFANLFVLQNVPIFNGYIVLSPELNDLMLERIPTVLNEFKKPAFYYQATADGDLKYTKQAMKQLAESLSTVTSTNVFAKTDEFQNASHYSLVLHAIPNALYHIFSAYKPISTAEYNEKIVLLEKDHVLYLKQKYDLIKRDYGIDMKIRYSDFKAIEAAIIKNNDLNAFDDLAQLARKNYPKSMLADYFLAQLFENKSEDSKAMKYYLTAYQQDEIGDLSKTMMMEKAEKLKSKIATNKKGK